MELEFFQDGLESGPMILLYGGGPEEVAALRKVTRALAEAGLRRAAVEGEAEAHERTEYGQKYRVRSILNAPAGRTAAVVSIWIVRHGEAAPRFVTVMPE